jgi:hypothetical protein
VNQPKKQNKAIRTLRVIENVSCLVTPLLIIATGFWVAFSNGFSIFSILILIPFLAVGGFPLVILFALLRKDFKDRKKEKNKTAA